MDRSKAKSVSKFLSLVLRHQPEVIDLQLDSGGWANVEELLQKCSQARRGRNITREGLVAVVEANDKQRFAFSADGKMIRASQGHSLAVDLGYEPVEPPARLWHGTATKFMPGIYSAGLQKRNRQHVHLSADRATATAVGQRHGSPVVLRVYAHNMYDDNFRFFLSANGVWLTDHVPVNYLQKEPDTRATE